MHFSQLRLTGFKSFVDPTELIIEPGTTGIVGPNGCGKSNIVEALRWVMGETSAKKIRGGEMDDVIFSGTSNRPARNLAEVQLLVDNAARTAPAQFNETDELNVVRQIQRDMGSRYLVNGQDVRARDIQLLFADANAGAQSTALVSQGHIGAIVNAKPQQRRGILEEAAGIRGLHSRRHEAELRLRAAENNLERVDDVLQTLDMQMRGLKRQARQASRYRNISGHIRETEAMHLHLRWIASASDLEQAEQAMSESELEVSKRTAKAAEATNLREASNQTLAPLRQNEAELAAGLHRLAIEKDRLEEERERIQQEGERLADRLTQIEADVKREERQLLEAQSGIDSLLQEKRNLEEASRGETGKISQITNQLGELDRNQEETQHRLQEATAEAASVLAQRYNLTQQMEEGEVRLKRQYEAQIEAQRELAIVNSILSKADDLAGSDTDTLQLKASAAKEDASKAEGERKLLDGREQTAREQLASAESEAGRLQAEVTTLSDLLKIRDDDLWPPLIDAVSVEGGYEIALGSALGDDLNSPTDNGAPVHWLSLPPLSDAPALPDGAVPLNRFVQAPPVLSRRLSQIGLVEQSEGKKLMSELRQGQRLVTREGALWRWDGLVVTDGTATPAATRLKLRNRLKELQTTLSIRKATLASTTTDFENAQIAANLGRNKEDEQRSNANAAVEALSEARETLAENARQRALTESRVSALQNLELQIQTDIEEIKRTLAKYKDTIEELNTEEQSQNVINALREDTEKLREAVRKSEYEKNRLHHEASFRSSRKSSAEKELEGWQQRLSSGEQQISDLQERRYRVKAEIEEAKLVPNKLEQRQQELLTKIDHFEGLRRQAADQLQAAEHKVANDERNVKVAQTSLSEAREERVRRQSVVELGVQQLREIATNIQEKMECEPQEALSKAGHSAKKDLPDVDSVEIRLNRLRQERERMGPVNLRADIEAGEIQEQVETLNTERDDLVGAIARLRQGISSLNREGRERMLTSFEQVNQHFKELFTTLFQGGRAQLELVDSHDPLEAGLEIMARPPGKRMQSMSLLSGGEQALTALALLFAVFQTNPAPICVLDEVDAPLDDANVTRFCDLVEALSQKLATRFLIITHNSISMSRMDRLYGVTMEEHGVSQLVSVDLVRAADLRDAVRS